MNNNGQHRPLPRPNRMSLAAAMVPHYRAAINMVERLQICHAVGLLASAKLAIARAVSNLGGSPFRFTSSSLPTTAFNDDQFTSVDGNNIIASDAPFADHPFITIVQPTDQPACSSNTLCFIGFIGGMSASFARQCSTYLDSFQALSMTHYIFSTVPTE